MGCALRRQLRLPGSSAMMKLSNISWTPVGSLSIAFPRITEQLRKVQNELVVVRRLEYVFWERARPVQDGVSAIDGKNRSLTSNQESVPDIITWKADVQPDELIWPAGGVG